MSHVTEQHTPYNNKQSNKDKDMAATESSASSTNMREERTDIRADNKEENEENVDEEEETSEGIPLKHCLFCVLQFDELEECLDHMLKQHGFFIPCVC